MTRRTGYQSKNAKATLVLGEPKLGTSTWGTEYDSEFFGRHGLEEQPSPQPTTDFRKSLQTPRSLKKGFVHANDYQTLDEQYGQALAAYRELELQVGVLEQRLGSLQANERSFLASVEEEHAGAEELRARVAGMSESLGRMLGSVERNRALMALMNSVAEAPVDQTVTTGSRAFVQEAESARRLSALEARMGDMAAAVTQLGKAVAQATLLQQQQPWGGAGRGLASADGRQGRAGSRRHQESIERLPNPPSPTTKQTFWKP